MDQKNKVLIILGCILTPNIPSVPNVFASRRITKTTVEVTQQVIRIFEKLAVKEGNVVKC